MTNSNPHKWMHYSFNFLFLVLYLVFLYLDFFTHLDSSLIKYLFLWVCLFYLLSTKKTSLIPVDWLLVFFGFLLTTIADYFLLFTNEFLVGIGCFCLVQLVYIKRLLSPRRFSQLLLGFILVVIFLFVTASQLKLPTLYFAAAIYGILLLTNAVLTFLTHAAVKRTILKIGMSCFVLCDLNVAFFNLLPASMPLYSIAEVSMWLFYAPALYCISHSCLDKKERLHGSF